MEFESPDVAKEFPGLAQALDDSPENEDGGKGKRKKSKDSTSKKDKDKGYAALDGESSPEEEQQDLHGTTTKSPGKVKKIKSFKLTSSKKKDKKSSEKDKDKEHKKLNEKEPKKPEKEKPLEKIKDKEPIPFSSPPPSIATTSTTPRRPFDGKSIIRPHAPLASLLSQTPSSFKSKDKVKEKDKDKDSTSKDKEKDSKRERKESGSGAGALKVKLRLRRGSKSSIEEPEPHHFHGHIQDTPEVIVKEIHKYETLLEQTHAQCNKGKKISKKHEELLWELQRNLTQLKRKLRSINALSTISIDREREHHQPLSQSPKSKKSTIVAKENALAAVDTETTSIKPILEPLCIPEFELDLTQQIFVPVPTEDLTLAHPEETAAILEEKPSEQDLPRKSSNTSDVVSLPKPPSRTPSPALNLETQSQKSELSEDDENENEVVHAEIHRIPSSECPTDSEEEEIELEQVGEDAEVLLPSPCADHDERLSIGEDANYCSIEDDQSPYPELRMAPSNIEGITDGICPSPTSRLQGFDPFSLSLFKSDEFLEYENDALLKFNGELQDEIVNEEDEIQKIITKLNNTPRREDSTIKELEEIEDDELFSIWQTARAENDLLHERIMHLKAMVVAYKIDIFKLEVRQRYLEQLKKSGDVEDDSNGLCNGNGNGSLDPGLQILTHH